MTAYSVAEKYKSSTNRSGNRGMPRWIGWIFAVAAIGIILALWSAIPTSEYSTPVVALPAVNVAQAGASEADRYRAVFGDSSVIELTAPGVAGPRVLAIGHLQGSVRPGPMEIADGKAALWVELPTTWDSMNTGQREAWRLDQYRKFFGPVDAWEGGR